MNLYIVVEGEQTETKVYPAWLQILVPQLHRIDDAWNLSENSDSYYLFSAGGIPSIDKHVSNAVADINEINACGKGKYDYLLMCIDVEEESRQYLQATLGYEYDPTYIVNERRRIVNPFGFKVTSYRVDEELR